MPEPDYVVLHADGTVDAYDWIDAGPCEIKKLKSGNWEIWDETDKKVLTTMKTVESAEEYFVQRDKSVVPLFLLKHGWLFDADVDIESIKSLIAQDNILRTLVKALFPEFKKTEIPTGKIFLGADTIVADGKATWTPWIIPQTDPEEHRLLTVASGTRVIDGNGEILSEQAVEFSFLEILCILYGRNVVRKKITIKKDGIYAEDGTKIQDNFVALLNPVDIEPGVTLTDIFNIVANDATLKLFVRAYTGCGSIDALHQEVYDKPKNKDRYFALQLKKYLHGVMFAGLVKPTVRHFTGFHKDFIAPQQVECELSCLPVCEFAHLEVRLDKLADINGKGVKAIEEFTLLEVLDAIYEEISVWEDTTEIESFKEAIHCVVTTKDEKAE